MTLAVDDAIIGHVKPHPEANGACRAGLPALSTARRSRLAFDDLKRGRPVVNVIKLFLEEIWKF